MTNNARKQPQRVPPPLLEGSERIDGQGILDEFSGDDALLIWKTYRSVRLWAELGTAQRRELVSTEAFAARSELIDAASDIAEISDALVGLAEMLRRPITRPMVVSRCRIVERWAEARGAGKTALEFGQLAALAAPEDADVAVDVAKRGRDLAEYARAESWYWQAIVRSRRSHDWDAYVRGMLGLGLTHIARGRYPAASRSFERGLRRARRQGLRAREAMALHELTGLAIRTDNLRKAVRFGRMAADTYGPGHSRLPALTHDIAVYWMSRGYFRVALDVIAAIPESYGTPADQLIRASSLVRAAGAVRAHAVFDEASKAAAALIDHPLAASRASIALTDLARGFLSIGDSEAAATAAGRALQIAITRGEGERVLDAESVLQESTAATSVARARVRNLRAPEPVASFAAELVEKLSGERATAISAA